MKQLVFIICLFVMGATNAQELESLIQVALQNSPTIQKVELSYNIATEKVEEVNSIPNTELSAGFFMSEPETRTGPQRYRLSARQMFPWFGSITAREKYMGAMSDEVLEELEIAKRKLTASVSQSYYRLYALKAKQLVLADNIELLKTYETLALSSLEVGKASAVSVLRLQMRQNELHQMKQVLQQQFLAEQTNFNKLLNREGNEMVVVTNGLTITEDASFPEDGGFNAHPELLKFDKMLQSVEMAELLNQKEAKPMLGIGLDYIAVSERTDMDVMDNGKDILMPMVSVSIPLFNKKYRSQTKQNKLQLQEIGAKKQERMNVLVSAYDMALKNRVSAVINFNTQTKNLKQAKNAEEILLKSYQTGTINFNDVLDIQELQLKFQTNQIESIKDYHIQTTIINYLLK